MKHPIDIGCPGCGYSLRGLDGSVVRCPECGRECDVDELIGRRLRSRSSTGYLKLSLAAVLSVPAVAMNALATWLLVDLSVAAPWTTVFGLAMLAGWGYLARTALRRWPRREALEMAALVHAVVLLRLVCAVILSATLIGFLVSVVFLAMLERDGPNAVIVFLVCLVFAPASYFALALVGRWDRRLASRFTKRELAST